MSDRAVESETFDILKMGRDITARQRRTRVMRALAGGALILAAVRVRGLLGAIALGSGVYAVYRAFAGYSLRSDSPRSNQSDWVDEASAQSFPASDPPAFPLARQT